MFEIDKQAFGTFVAQLRRERGYTQKELAEKLFVSDKAVSKWETGVSIPDTALLVPLAELLDVTVTEMLLCRRVQEDAALDPQQVDGVVKTALSYPEEARCEYSGYGPAGAAGRAAGCDGDRNASVPAGAGECGAGPAAGGRGGQNGTVLSGGSAEPCVADKKLVARTVRGR